MNPLSGPGLRLHNLSPNRLTTSHAGTVLIALHDRQEPTRHIETRSHRSKAGLTENHSTTISFAAVSTVRSSSIPPLNTKHREPLPPDSTIPPLSSIPSTTVRKSLPPRPACSLLTTPPAPPHSPSSRPTETRNSPSARPRIPFGQARRRSRKLQPAPPPACPALPPRCRAQARTSSKRPPTPSPRRRPPRSPATSF